MKSGSASGGQQRVNLSCEQCQQRKTRCDKSHPCGSCQKANIECTAVQRRRLPRGRTATGRARDTELRDRVAQLEALLATHIAEAGGSFEPNVSPIPILVDSERQEPGPNIEEPFWTALSDNVIGIREALEEDFPEEQTGNESQVSCSSDQELEILLFGDSSSAFNPIVTEAPAESSIYALLSIYLQRVDPIFKVMHTPTLRTAILSKRSNSSDLSDDPKSGALRFAVYFAAVCSLEETECLDRFKEDKSDLSSRFRRATELMLFRANLQKNRDITVLQALVIYLAARRTHHGHRNISLLVAIAARKGQLIGLDVEDPRIQSPFQQEMRRRLWYSICLLDMQAAFDMGSRASISQSGVLGTMPKYINDADISPAFFDSPVELPGFTDMTFSLMTYDAMLCWRKLTHVAVDSEGQPQAMQQDWGHRSEIVKNWEQRLKERYLQYCDQSQPFEHFTKLVGEGMMVTMQLLERRPLHGFSSRGLPPNDGYDLLKVTSEVLEVSLAKQKNQSLAPWDWHSWAKWYALAVLLAELCCNKQEPRYDRAWSVAQASFSQVMNSIADDALQASLEKLMERARWARNAYGILVHQSPPTIDTWILPPEVSRRVNVNFRESGLSGNGEEHLWYEDSNFNMQASDESAQPLAPEPMLEVDEKTLDAWMTDPDVMSSMNWETFVQDFSSHENDKSDS